MKQIPYIAKDSRGLWTLYVDEKPYLMLGGEIHNSSSSQSAVHEGEGLDGSGRTASEYADRSGGMGNH